MQVSVALWQAMLLLQVLAVTVMPLLVPLKAQQLLQQVRVSMEKTSLYQIYAEMRGGLIISFSSFFSSHCHVYFEGACGWTDFT